MDYNSFYWKMKYPYPSTATSELDFIQHWEERTVEKEIIRGKQLQQLKEQTPIVPEYDVVNVDSGKVPFCEPGGSQSTRKPQKITPNKHIHQSKKGKKKESVCICRSPKSSRKRKVTEKCPLRIAELAVPTKRQCLQNWINNKDILPDVMIYRLQQIIRDQKPVVEISDAIQCFKTHRSKRKQKSECKKKYKKCLTKNLNKAKNLSDARVFCGVFGHRMAQILNKRMVIELNSELERLANVVTMDIVESLSQNQHDFKKITKNKSMLDEISSKITLWIWSIIDEANHLILEDQLRELEEVIGPCLDIIDDLIDNVVDICYVEPTFEDISSKSSTDSESLEKEEVPEKEEVTEEEQICQREQEVEEEQVAGGEQVDEEPKTESKEEIHPTDSFTNLDRLADDITDDIIKQISSIINNICDDDNGELSHIFLNENSKDINLRGEKSSQQSLEDNEFVDADDHNEDNIPKPDMNANEQLENPEDLSNNFRHEERDEEGKQVSDDFSDGKKVTFSQLNTVTETNSKDIISSEDEGDNSETLNWKTSLNKFVFAEPNDNLLSEVDELWPGDIKYEEILKTTITINKSISSMGKIFETEERASISPAEDVTDHHKIEPQTNEHLHERELDEVKIGDILAIATKLYNPQLIDDKSVQTSIDKTNFNNYRKLRNTGINTSPNSSTTSRRMKRKTDTSLSLADFSKKPTDKDDFHSIRVKPRLNYKVCPCTAPAWAMKGFYESSEGSNHHKRPINSCQTRKWCNDLLTGYNNLKFWSNWLDETSKRVAKLQRKKAKCCPNTRKYATKWMRLKKDIDNDADIWNKKHRCTKKQLAEYKDLYRDNLVPKIDCKYSKKIL